MITANATSQRPLLPNGYPDYYSVVPIPAQLPTETECRRLLSAARPGDPAHLFALQRLNVLRGMPYNAGI